MNIVQVILLLSAGYALIGLLFAVVFVSRGITTVDPAAKGSSVLFRALIIPGAAALWPVMLAHWRKTTRNEATHDAR